MLGHNSEARDHQQLMEIVKSKDDDPNQTIAAGHKQESMKAMSTKSKTAEKNHGTKY